MMDAALPLRTATMNMTPALDLFLLPLLRQAGKDRPKLPGLYAADAPRRAARGRAADRFFVYLTTEGNAPLSSKELDALLAQMADLYFKASGSSTAAMRFVAETLNDLLLQRNMNAASRGRQATGILALGVIRHNHLYLLQSGASQAYLITTDSAQQFYDPVATGRGLGLSRTPSLHFHQAELRSGDVLLLSSNPPLSWNTTTLRNLHGLAVGDLYRRLVRRAEGDIEAAMVLVKTGKGQLRLMTPRANSEPLTSPLANESQLKRDPTSRAPETASRPLGSSPIPPPRTRQPSRTGIASSGISVSPIKTGTDTKVAQASPTPKKLALPRESSAERMRKAWDSSWAPGIQAVGRAVGTTLQQLLRATQTLFERMLPDENMVSMSGATMAFGAVAIPLMVVAVAAVVYFQNGRGRYYDDFMVEAQRAVEQAQQFEHAGEQRIAWQAALQYLDNAEMYRITEDSQTLRNYAEMALDSLDLVGRLIFQPVIEGGLPGTVEIRRIVATRENELYLLDGISGSVFRAVATGNTYRLDPNFTCGPVPGPLIVGPLMDIAALPPGYPNGAALIAMDGNGNLVQCIPGSDKQLSYSMLPPSSNWGKPMAFAMDSGDLYVLDLLTSSVWIYDGATEYRDLPYFFFGDQVPSSMQDVIDLTVSDGRLYLLYNDGHLVISDYGEDTVIDPQFYDDSREGYEDAAVFPGAKFDEIQFAPPPDPSIYLFDGDAHAIYHFSLQMVYQRQYRPQGIPFTEPASAFTIGPKHQAFISIGNQIYSALLP